MRHFLALLFSAMTLCNAHAQDIILNEIGELSAEEQVSFYAKAEELNSNYFAMKANPASSKDEMYQNLLAGYENYVKSLDIEEGETLNDVKNKIRKLRPEFEEAGIYFSNAGSNAKASKYIKTYLEIPKLTVFNGEKFAVNQNYATYVLMVASELHNAHDLESAVVYFKEYIELGEKNRQEMCYSVLANDLDKLHRYDEEAEVLDEGLTNYPNNVDMLKMGVTICMAKNNTIKAKNYLDRAIELAPNDANLVLYNAMFLEETGHYDEALPIYLSFHQNYPTDISMKKRLALCYYNMGSSLINKSNQEQDMKVFKPMRDEAIEIYGKAAPLLQEIINTEGAENVDKKFIVAISDAYKQMGKEAEANKYLAMTGQNTQPNDGNSEAGTATANTPQSKKQGVPNFIEWYKPEFDKKLSAWEAQGEFEKAKDYAKRVNEKTRKELMANLRKEFETQYINEYSSTFNLTDLTLKTYDPDHETYKIVTKQGDLYLNVPISNDEAKSFKETWNAVRLTDPKFKVNKAGELLLASATFVTPQGNSYLYDVNQELTYGKVKVAKPVWEDEDEDLIVDNDKPDSQDSHVTVVDGESEAINVGASAVDVNLPKTKMKNENMFALVISNEKYHNVGGVPFAENDGKSFIKYCTQVLGIPEDNIVHANNATYGQMMSAVSSIQEIENAFPDMRLLVYYSGHGMPDGNSEAYLLPVDGTPNNYNTAYKLSKFYKDIAQGSPKNITVFLDACFSGSNKSGEVMDSQARGVVIKAKSETPTSNMVVFSACSGSETAYPYENQKHGLFTFFLLKQLQNKKGSCSYKELAEFITTNVKQQSFRINKKIQNPTIQTSLPANVWGSWRLDK